MPPKISQRRIWLTVGLLVAFVLLSGALRQFSLAPGLRIGQDFAETMDSVFASQERQPERMGGEFVSVLVSIMTGLSIILFIVALLVRENRLPTLTVFVLAFLMGLLLSNLVTSPESIAPTAEDMYAGQSGEGLGATETMDPEDAVSEYERERTVPWAWSLIVIGPVLVGTVFILRPYWQSRRMSAEERAGTIAQEAASAIREGANLTDAIQRCYLDMVKAFEKSSGVRRRASMTPREFENRLRKEGVANEHVRGLTRLFEKSRYAPGTPDPGDEDAAVKHLNGIAADLGNADN